MDDAFRVRGGERLAGLEDVLDGQRGRLRSRLRHHATQIATFQSLHHDERRAVARVANIEDAGHVLASEADGDPSLSREPRYQIRVRNVVRTQKLERHLVAEIDTSRRHDEADVADADDLDDLVLASDDLACLKRHDEAFAVRGLYDCAHGSTFLHELIGMLARSRFP